MTVSKLGALGILVLTLSAGCDDDDPGTGTTTTGTTGSTTDTMTTGTTGSTTGDMGDAGMEMDAAATTGSGGFDRSQYSDVGTDGPLDYSVPEMWVCRPDIESAENQCHNDMTATLIKPDGSREVVEHTRATDPAFDCFYVYPTVLLSGDPQMVDFSQAGVDMVNDPLQTQGARFSSMCRMFAPFYRQIGLMGGAPVEGSDPALGAQDVRDAFQHYLDNWNEGRDFVLIGHSQGSRMLVNMVQQDIDNDPEVRAKMISALLIGIDIAVPKDGVVGGDFQNVPLCTQPGERGCVVTYVSYADDDPPMEGDLFGQDPDENTRVGCVDPATLSGNQGLYQASYFRSLVSNNPTFAPDNPPPADLETPFLVYHELFDGECVEADGFSYLKVSVVPQDESDTRTPPWRTTAVEEAGFGLHLMDFHIPMGDLLETVAMQAAAQ